MTLLAASLEAGQVVVLNRRHTDEFKGIPKVREVLVLDMDNLAEAAEHATMEAGATIAFCAIGVGKGSQKMPEAEFRKIEVQYPEAFATGCKAGGVLSMGLMTAVSADIKSWFTYVRIIGEKEKAVIGVGIPTLGIYKPSVILGNTNTPSYLGYVLPAVQWILPSRYYSIHKNELARAMVEGTQNALDELLNKNQGGAHGEPTARNYEYRDMRPLFEKNAQRR